MSVMVSVVIPVYNIEQHLRQCLDSVAAQTLKDIEIICVDDGSTDGSANILEEYAEKDARFQIIRQKNAGPGAARNRGMEQTAGKYLIFLDSDDWFEPDFLQCMVEDAEQTGADVTICRADEFDTNTGKVYDGTWMLKTQFLPGKVFAPEDVAQHVFQFTYGWPWDKLYRRKFVLKGGFHFPDLKISQDLAFVFPSILKAEKIGIINRILVHHRVNRNASISNNRSQLSADSFTAAELLFQFMHNKQIYEIYRVSYVNWVVEFLIWHIGNIGDRTIQQNCYQKMRKVWFPRLNEDQNSRIPIKSKTVLIKYFMAKYLPYRFFSATISFYKKLKHVKQEFL